MCSGTMSIWERPMTSRCVLRKSIFESVLMANDYQEAAECYVKREYGGGKGAGLEIRLAWRGQRRQGSSGVIGRCR